MNVECPSCLYVRNVPASECRAALNLIRPGEVVHVAAWIDANSAPDRATADIVGDWLEANFDKGILRYVADPPVGDVWCSPGETLGRGGGDCDDLAILATSLLRQCDVDAQLVLGNVCDHQGCVGHAWVEGQDEEGWYLLEATNGALHRDVRPYGYHAQLVAFSESCRVVS